MLKNLTLGAVAALAALQAGATVLTFDDLPTFADSGPTGIRGSYFDSAAAGTNGIYQGFGFANENGNRWFWNPNPDTSGGPYSGVGGSTWLGVDTSGAPSGATDNLAPAITSTVDFVFDGASFAGFESVRYVLSLDGAEVFTSAACTLTTAHAFCSSGYGGLVDKVVIQAVNPPGVNGIFFAMDNFTVNSPQPGTVPEPASLALVAGGLALAGFTRRRRAAR